MRSPVEQPRADFASLNTALTTLLGGKQKAWMTPDQQSAPSYATESPCQERQPQTIRQAPRDSNTGSVVVTGYRVNTEPGHQHPLQWNSGRPSLEQGSSNSTSPVLANVINQPKESFGQPPSATNGFADTVLPSPAPSDDIHSNSSHNVVDLETEQDDPEARRLIDLAARCGGIDALERRLFSVDRPESLPLAEPTGTTDRSSAVVPEGEAFSVAQQEPPRKRSLGLPRSQNKRAKLQTPNGPSTRPAESIEGDTLRRENSSSVTDELQTPPSLSLKQHVPILDSYVTRLGCIPSLKGSIELPRIRLLKDACNTEDRFYLVLHQLYCLYSVEPQTIMQLPGFSQDHIQAFNTLAQLLLGNDMLPDYATKWFSVFPAPIQNLLLSSTVYETAYNNVRNFLFNLLRYWHIIQARCKQRMYPPLVDELVYELHLKSGVFQRVAFTAVLRCLWGPDQSPWYQKVEELFRQDQIDSVHRRYRINIGDPSTAAEMQAANVKLARNYQMLRKEHIREVRGHSSTSSTAEMPVTERSTARLPTQRASLPSSCEPGFALPITARNDPHTRPEVRRTQSVANMPAPTSQLPHYNLVSANNQTRSTQRPCVLTPSYGVPTPVAFPPPNDPRARTPQTQQNQPGVLRTQQQQIAQPDLNRAPSNSTTERSIPPFNPPNRHPQYDSSQPGLETVPPGASEFQVPVRHQEAAMPGYGSPHTTNSVSRTARLGEQLLIPSGNQVSRFSSHPNPTSSALHQAHLRSPILKPVDAHDTEDISVKFYQYVAKLALTPQIIFAGSRNLVWSFHVSEVDFELIPSDTPGAYGAPPTRRVHSGSQMYRVRCAKLSSLEAHINDSAWAVAESVWPSYLFIEVNGVRLSLRRKQQHGKDLPIDITPHVKKGANQVTICLIGPSKLNDSAQYALAVENIHVIEHKQALDMAVPVPAHEVIDPIRAILTSNPSDDEELTVVDNTITINLIDPFSARIFNVPVRSLACRHRECFDHENYLQTRKTKQAGWPCMLDEWRCPVCNADARPQNLILDCFLVEVREELLRQKRLSTKAIVIEADGKWRPKLETRDDIQGESLLDPTYASSAAAASGGRVLPTPRRESVVIELDDD